MPEEPESLESCILQHMEEDDMTREAATAWCKHHLQGHDQDEQRPQQLEDDYDKKWLPKAEESFKKLLNKRRHWIDKRPH